MPPAHKQTLSQNDFSNFRKLLEEESGLLFNEGHQERLEEAIQAQMDEKKFASPADYYMFLKFKPEGARELRALVELLTVGETFFFRNEPQFDVLSKHLLPSLIQKKSTKDKNIKIWSAGCSTGEEPYSIALAVMNALPDPAQWKTSILATDINHKQIELAKRAEYGARSVSLVPPQWLNTYFKPQGSFYVLNDLVKSRVDFASHNLAKDPFSLPGMTGLDIIFCRNVTIYFGLDTTKRILNQFADCLVEGGYLFIGHSETLWQLSDKFVPMEYPRTFVYQKQTKAQPAKKTEYFTSLPETEAFLVEPDYSEDRSPENNSSAVLLKNDEADESYDLGSQALKNKKYEEALVCFEKVSASGTHYTDAQLALASIRANREEYAPAVKILSKLVAANSLLFEAYYLLGIVHSKMADYKKAVEAFQKAVYIDPECAITYLYLGNIYRRLGYPAKAKREYQNALAVLKNKGDEEPVKFSEEMSCGHLRTACQRSIQNLEEHERI